MASYKKILEEKNLQFRTLQQEEKEELASVERILRWKVLEDARAQIKANFQDKRRGLREDPVYKAALLQNFNSNLFHLDENDWTGEEPKSHQFQEESQPVEVVYVVPKEDEDKDNKMKIVCPKCGETDHQPGAKFCHVCGNKFNIDESNQEKEKLGKISLEKETKRAQKKWKKKQKKKK